MTSLSVVMPVYNEAEHLPATVDALVEAVERSGFEADLVLVDDGSTDGSAAVVADAVADRLALTSVRQANRGRFEARRAGLARATGELTLLLDGRVRLAPGALAFVRERVNAGERAWTGHVHVLTDGNPFGTFQNVLTEIAWRHYFDDPRPLRFGVEGFDRYPKGSGCFLAPRELLLDVFGTSLSRYADSRHMNDDAPMLRALAATEPIHVAPEFAAEYVARGSLRTFLRHSLHRGTVFFDGHGRRESRFFPLAIAFFPLSAAAAIAGVARPRLVRWTVMTTAATAGTVALAARRRPSEVLTVALLAPAWAIAFGAGLWRGLALHVAAGGGHGGRENAP